MEERKYMIYDDYGTIIAKDMSLETTAILIRALFETFYNDYFKYTIEPQPFTDCKENKNDR